MTRRQVASIKRSEDLRNMIRTLENVQRIADTDTTVLREQLRTQLRENNSSLSACKRAKISKRNQYDTSFFDRFMNES